MHKWIDKDTELYCSFAKVAGNIGCQLMNSAFYYYNLNKIYKSFSIDNIKEAVNAAKTLNIKGFAVTMPYKIEVLNYVDIMSDEVKQIGAANTILNCNNCLAAYNTDYIAAQTILYELYDEEANLCILGNGGYARAVKAAGQSLNYNITMITRNNWADIKEIKNSLIYNCTPVENIEVGYSNKFIDCIVTTKTGKRLATIQAANQFELYTGLEFPFKDN